jgi:hypothetical protein
MVGYSRIRRSAGHRAGSWWLASERAMVFMLCRLLPPRSLQILIHGPADQLRYRQPGRPGHGPECGDLPVGEMEVHPDHDMPIIHTAFVGRLGVYQKNGIVLLERHRGGLLQESQE